MEWVIGGEKTERPVDVSFNVKHRVPLANEWLSHGLPCQALSVAAMARRLRRSDLTAGKHRLNGEDWTAMRSAPQQRNRELRSPA